MPTDIIIIIFAALFGLCAGSFLNVVIYRLPRKNMSLVFPPSHCTVCETNIPAYDNLPVLSWLFLGGRCRFCRTQISLKYPAVELATGLIFFIAAYTNVLGHSGPAFWPGFGMFVIEAVFLASLLAILMIDIEMRLIPDELAFSFRGCTPTSLCSPFPRKSAAPCPISRTCT